MKHSTHYEPCRFGYLCIVLVLILLSPALLKASLEYNFSYHFRGATHGRILLIIPFRVYYESFATVDFIAMKNPDGFVNFAFDGIPESGFMMRTSGFSGKTLVALAADYDLKKGLNRALKCLNEFDDPYYSRFIKRRKPFLFKIYSVAPETMGFRRSPDGIHSHATSNISVRFQYYPEVLNIDFNIYKILLEMIQSYNHSFLPGENLESLLKRPQQEWDSPEMNYSGNINRTVVLAARIMKRIQPFRQRELFRIHYRVSELTPSRIEITGLAVPDVYIWGKYLITRVFRKVVIRITDRVLLEDTHVLHIQNSRGNGLQARMTLKLKH
jgi:hypothetical protein